MCVYECISNVIQIFSVFYYCTVDLKAEVEKLRAAQMSSQGVEPERVRLFQQEISALRSKLCQQEREMLEANRLVLQFFLLFLVQYFIAHML